MALWNPSEKAIGQIYSPPSFFSTTTELSVAKRFLRKAKAPSKKYVFWNIKKAQGPYLERASALYDEKEGIFPPGSRFRVEKIEGSDAHTEFGFPISPQVEVIKIDLTPLDQAFRISKDD